MAEDILKTQIMKMEVQLYWRGQLIEALEERIQENDPTFNILTNEEVWMYKEFEMKIPSYNKFSLNDESEPEEEQYYIKHKSEPVLLSHSVCSRELTLPENSDEFLRRLVGFSSRTGSDESQSLDGISFTQKIVFSEPKMISAYTQTSSARSWQQSPVVSGEIRKMSGKSSRTNTPPTENTSPFAVLIRYSETSACSVSDHLSREINRKTQLSPRPKNHNLQQAIYLTTTATATTTTTTTTTVTSDACKQNLSGRAGTGISMFEVYPSGYIHVYTSMTGNVMTSSKSKMTDSNSCQTVQSHNRPKIYPYAKTILDKLERISATVANEQVNHSYRTLMRLKIREAFASLKRLPRKMVLKKSKILSMKKEKEKN